MNKIDPTTKDCDTLISLSATYNAVAIPIEYVICSESSTNLC